MADSCPLSLGGASLGLQGGASLGLHGGASLSLQGDGVGNPTHELLMLIANDDAEGMTQALRAGMKWSVFQIGSPVHAAVTYGAAACVERLLADGAAVDAPNKDGHTPLHLAAVEGSAGVVTALLAARADALAKSWDARAKLMSGGLVIDMPGGRTPLHLAAVHANVEAVRVLLEACPEAAGIADLDGATPRDAGLREGACTRKAAPPPGRVAVAQLLAPDAPIPAPEELQRLAEADMVKRRKRGDATERERKAVLEAAALAAALPAAGGYEAADSELYGLSAAGLSGLLAPELAAALEEPHAATRTEALRGLLKELTPGVHAFRLFSVGQPTDDGRQGSFGQRLLTELAAIEAWATSTGWDLKRPNSMNRYGVVLKDVGLGSLAAALASAVVAPLATLLWPERTEGGLGNLHAFTVRYRGGEDRRLDTHVDSSEVTLNVCLGGGFRGGGVYFHGLASENGGDHGDAMASPHPVDCPHCRVTHPHEPGLALLHLGEHIHGAHNIEEGERTNLVLWCRRQA
uniref:Fe2OG dioxygenase domain-containing protein n=1 Tax=Alexandrium monilatum TaxID=311494 RepID=A0A7S4UZZ7_9DINO